MDDVQGLVKFTGLVITGVLSQKIPVDVGRAVLYGVAIQKSLLEVGDLEARLTALEQTAAGQQQPQRLGRHHG